MRDIPSGLADHLTKNVQTLAMCVKLTRRDGVVLGFTSFNQNLEIDGTTYEAESALDATAIRQEIGTGVDNLDAVGVFRSESITDEDLRAGRYDNAFIELFMVNWADLTDGKLILQTGTLGEVTAKDSTFTTEFRSLSQRLAQQIGRVTTPTCTVRQLGDAECKVNIEDFQFSRTVAAFDVNTDVITFGGDTHPTDYYTYGRVIFTSGENDGLDREIKVHASLSGTAVITLQLPFPFPVAVGDTAILEAGCDRRIETCFSRFDNVINFRGFPKIPGNDKLMERGRKP